LQTPASIRLRRTAEQTSPRGGRAVSLTASRPKLAASGTAAGAADKLIRLRRQEGVGGRGGGEAIVERQKACIDIRETCDDIERLPGQKCNPTALDNH